MDFRQSRRAALGVGSFARGKILMVLKLRSLGFVASTLELQCDLETEPDLLNIEDTAARPYLTNGLASPAAIKQLRGALLNFSVF